MSTASSGDLAHHAGAFVYRTWVRAQHASLFGRGEMGAIAGLVKVVLTL
jgi:hypothetical protein